MIIHAGCDIITRMDISLLSTTNDIEQLRTLALAMVQNAVSENAEKEEKLRQQNTTLQQRILLLEEALKLARQQRFGKKSETLAGMQRSLFEEDMDADIAAVETDDMILIQNLRVRCERLEIGLGRYMRGRYPSCRRRCNIMRQS